LIHAGLGHPAYLFGEWRHHGWWYYLPVAIALKTPLPLLLLAGAAGIILAMRGIETRFVVLAPLLAATVYLALAMSGGVSLGIRYLLPAAPMVTVSVVAILNDQLRRRRWAAWALLGWLALTTMRARPFYIEYFNELAGGTENGYRYLVDSNYDWGQDLKRLQTFVRDRQVDHLYLSFLACPRL